jgi:hypothetical protein
MVASQHQQQREGTQQRSIVAIRHLSFGAISLLMMNSCVSRSALLLAFWVSTGTTAAFVLQQPRVSSESSITTQSTSSVQLSANSNDKGSTVAWVDAAAKTLTSGFVAACLWAAPLPASLVTLPGQQQPYLQDINVAMAKEMASGSGSRVNKDAESLLRLGLPIKDKEVSWEFCSKRCPHTCSYVLINVLRHICLVYNFVCHFIYFLLKSKSQLNRSASCKRHSKRSNWILEASARLLPKMV